MTTTVSTNAKAPRAEGYEVRIGARYYRLAASPQDVAILASRDSLAERQDDQGSTAQNVLDIGYAWARTDYSGGEGFDWDPPEIPVTSALAAENPRRYWDSESIDVERPGAGNKYELKLAKAFEEFNPTLTPVASISASKDFVFATDGDTIRWYDSFDDTLEEGSSTPVGGSNVVKVVAVSDDRVVALIANGDLYKRDAGAASFVELYNSVSDGHGNILDVWYAKGRWLAQDDEGHLIEVPYNDTAPVVVESISDAIVLSLVESGPAVVAAVSDGTLRTYNTVLNSGVPELAAAGRIDVPAGEVPYLLGSNAGRLLFLTYVNDTIGTRTVRLYQGEVLDARFEFVVGGIQLRREWFATTEVVNIASNIYNTRDTMLLTLDEAEGPAVWRYDLVTQGLSRLVRPFNADETHAIIEFQERIAVVSTTTDTIWVQSKTLYQQMGWIISPNITLGLNTDTAWIASVLEATSIVSGGAQVEMWYSTDPEAILDYQHSAWKLHHRISSAASSGIEVKFNAVKSRTIAIQLRIFSSVSQSVTPLVSRSAVRGIPAHRDRVFVLPINVSDYISVPGRRLNHVPNYGMLLQKELMGIVGDSVELELLRFDMVFNGIINNVQEPIVLFSDRGSPTTVMNIEFRGSTVIGVTTTGDAGVGLGHIGVATIGLGQTGAT